MKRKVISLLMAAVLAVPLCSFFGCAPREQIDDTKSQLSVLNYNGGVGTDWLYQTAADFEEQYVNTSFEEGKLGVQVHITPTKDTLITSIEGLPEDVYFTESTYFNNFAINGEVLDISDIVTSSLSDVSGGAETVSIESKLYPEQKAALTAFDGNYYALPHYEGIGGAIYDARVFTRESLYMKAAQDGSWNGEWTNTDSEKTVGPDGVRGTFDDGMPSSYEELDRLFERMLQVGITPFVWAGGYAATYTMWLSNAAWVAYDGKDKSMLAINFGSGEGEGVAFDMVTGFSGQDSGGYPVPQTTSATITPATAYNISQSVGRYYATRLSHQIFSDSRMYSDRISGATSHLDAQKYFIDSDLEEDSSPIGMLIEGIWWYGEAVSARQNSEARHPETGVNRDFRWFIFPRQATGSVKEGEGTRNTVIGQAMGYGFISADVADTPWKEELAKTFLKFCYTDQAIQDFNIISGVPKAVQYTLPEERLSELNNFALNSYEVYTGSDIVRAISDHPIFVNNQAAFEGLYNWWRSRPKGGSSTYPYTAFKSNNPVSAKDFFEGILTNTSESTWSTSYGRWF